MWSWKFFLVKLSLFSCVMFCLGAKPKFKRSIVNYKLSVGSKVRMKCELFTSTGVTVKWIKDGKFMEERRNGRLRIRTGRVSIFRIWGIKIADAGEYECRAQNKFGTASRKLNLIVLAGKPLFIKSPRTSLQFLAWPAASDLKLKCEADGARPLTYKWLKNGKPFTSRRRHDPKINTSRWFLRFVRVVPSDEGIYTCIVSNKLGNISISYKLGVSEKIRSRPILSLGFPKNKTVKTGSNVTFQCLEQHGSLTAVRWLKWHNPPNNPTLHESPVAKSSDYTLINPAQYVSFKSNIRNVYGMKIILTNVTKNDAGMYMCVVNNHIGTTWRSGFLIIDDSEDAGDKCRAQNKFGGNVKPKPREGKPWFIKPPKTSLQFLAWPAASNVTLKCAADGARPLTYTWLKNGKPFTSRRHDPNINTSRWFLRIVTVVPSDNGMYTCVVSNRLGAISHSYKFSAIN